MIEIWKPISGYEGTYEISNTGQVRSLPRDVVVNGKTVYTKHIAGRLLATYESDGYLYVDLNLHNSDKSYAVHRLVAQAFIPNPEHKPCVNHKNRCTHDNSVNNLEWVTYQENSLHAKLTGHDFGKAWRGKSVPDELRDKLRTASTRRTPVICIEDGNEYRSIKEAAEHYSDISDESISQSVKTGRTIKGKYTFKEVSKYALVL